MFCSKRKCIDKEEWSSAQLIYNNDVAVLLIVGIKWMLIFLFLKF